MIETCQQKNKVIQFSSIQEIVKNDYSTILATLIRLFDNFDLAEEVLQDAFEAALVNWPNAGIPTHPRAWLIQVAKNKAIDKIRKNALYKSKQYLLTEQELDYELSTEIIEDDHLRLIFTCCHPAIATETQIALTLKTIIGLNTAEISRALLQSETTIAQRLVRAKRKISDAKIPYRIPDNTQIKKRLHVVLKVIYLIFNEGYSAYSGETIVRQDLTRNAIQILRLLLSLLPDEYEVQALLALCLLQDSRNEARSDNQGNIVLLENQNRQLWNQQQIDEGSQLIKKVLSRSRISSYSLQAAIAAVHSDAKQANDTDWMQIRALYEILEKIQPDPIIELNRAVAVSKTDGALEALKIVTSLQNRNQLPDYHLLYTTSATLLSQLKQYHAARSDYEKALRCRLNHCERIFIEACIRVLNEKISPK